MSTEQSFVDYIVEQASLAGDVYARKMFGEYALYCDRKVVGLICDNTLYIKLTEQGKKYVGSDFEEGYAYPGAKPSMLIPEGLIEDESWIQELVRITANSLSAGIKKA